jgi:esterase/lipase superfamily enzyme
MSSRYALLVAALVLLLGGCSKSEAPKSEALKSEAHKGAAPTVTAGAGREGYTRAPESPKPVEAPKPASGAATIPTPSPLGAAHATVRVFFATDRKRTNASRPAEMFGTARSDLTYGICEVSIPLDHRMGELESPSILRFEFRENPEKHVVLLSAEVSSKEKFFADMATRVNKSKTSDALLFVHGYNVTFEAAARRTAQMTYDLGFDGAPVFYSWPSIGSVAAYTVDEQNVEWAQANLRAFLENFFLRSNAKNIHLIAHSMGNRALTRAVGSLLSDRPEFRKRLKEIILAAPDIDADVFKRDIAPALTATGRPVTLYASSEDIALVASKKVHGYPRAGDSGGGLVIFAGIETIDASKVDTSMLGHSYYAEARSILSDIFYIVRKSQRAHQRFGLREVSTPAGPYWEFKQ